MPGAYHKGRINRHRIRAFFCLKPFPIGRHGIPVSTRLFGQRYRNRIAVFVVCIPHVRRLNRQHIGIPITEYYTAILLQAGSQAAAVHMKGKAFLLRQTVQNQAFLQTPAFQIIGQVDIRQRCRICHLRCQLVQRRHFTLDRLCHIFLRYCRNIRIQHLHGGCICRRFLPLLSFQLIRTLEQLIQTARFRLHDRRIGRARCFQLKRYRFSRIFQVNRRMPVQEIGQGYFKIARFILPISLSITLDAHQRVIDVFPFSIFLIMHRFVIGRRYICTVRTAEHFYFFFPLGYFLPHKQRFFDRILRFGSRFAFTGQFLPPGRTLHRKCGGWQCLCRNHRAAHYCQQTSDPLFHFRIPSVLNFRNL